jgi:glycosyltransferase involved in cell wall biosynthesis
MKVSVVVPFHNEESSVTDLYVRTRTVMEAQNRDFEFVFVDDGSTDRTFAILSEISNLDERVTVVQLRRNYGQTEALVAGIDEATGEFIIAMDGDLQHRPEDIPKLLVKLDEGYDLVCGRRMTRPGDSVIKKQIPSRMANWAMRKASGVDVHDFGGGFKGFRTALIQQIPLYGQMHRFIPALATAYGARICEVPIEIEQRPHGKSHYGIGRIVPVFFDLLTIPFLLRYTTRPMHFFGKLGFAGFATSLLIAFYLLVDWLAFGSNLMTNHGPLMLFAIALMIAGLQLICLGFVGEMMVRNQFRKSVARDSEVLRLTRHRQG